MAFNDPSDKNLLRLEGRRFANRCEGQMALIQRADSLREVSRLASMSLPYALSEEMSARDAIRQVQTCAEDKARELITEQIHAFIRAEETNRPKVRRAIIDAWANLTGPLGHLRPWAQSKLAVAEQSVN